MIAHSEPIDETPTRGHSVTRTSDRHWPGNERYLSAMSSRGKPVLEMWPRAHCGSLELLFHVQIRMQENGAEAKAVGCYVTFDQPGFQDTFRVNDVTRRAAARQALDSL